MSGQSAQDIVDNNVNDLISTANTIVSSCKGLNCNKSELTRTSIRNTLSMMSLQQSKNTIFLLSIPSSSSFARSVRDIYLDMGSSVASNYNYRCQNIVPNSFTCVNTSPEVIAIKNKLVALLQPAVSTTTNNSIVYSSVGILLILVFTLFVIYITVYISSNLQYVLNSKSPPVSLTPPTTSLNQNPTPSIAVPYDLYPRY